MFLLPAADAQNDVADATAPGPCGRPGTRSADVPRSLPGTPPRAASALPASPALSLTRRGTHRGEVPRHPPRGTESPAGLLRRPTWLCCWLVLTPLPWPTVLRESPAPTAARCSSARPPPPLPERGPSVLSAEAVFRGVSRRSRHFLLPAPPDGRPQDHDTSESDF